MARWLLVLALAVGSRAQLFLGQHSLTPEDVHDLREWYGHPVDVARDGLAKLLLEEEVQEEDTENRIPLPPFLDPTKWVEGIYLPSTDASVVSNSQCRDDVDRLHQVWTNQTLQGTILASLRFWPLFLPDSWGKIPDGVLSGNVLVWGMQEECTDLHVDEHIDQFQAKFRGRYCLVSLQGLNGTNPGPPSDILPEGVGAAVRAGIAMGYPGNAPFFHYGTCMPSSCTQEDLVASINARLAKHKKVLHVDCHAEDDVLELTAGEVAYISVLGVLGFLLVAGVLADTYIWYTSDEALRKGPLRFILIFSAYSNMQKIFHINPEENPAVISCLHGLRVLSMTWVVWGHGYMFMVDVTKNLIGAAYMLTDQLIEQTITNATFSVDSFFFMSGLLVCYGVVMEHQRVGRVNWIMYYVHRFIRLAPPIAMTAGACATIGRLVLVGPQAASVTRGFVKNCQENWWKDTLFVSNLLESGMCLPQCWYTGVDTQIYVVLPLVMFPLIWRPKIGLPWMAVVTLASFVTPTTIIAVYNARTELSFGKNEDPDIGDVETYMKPWCRAHAYLVGCWCGYLLAKTHGKKVTLTWWQAALGWVLATTVAMLVLYGVANYNTVTDRDLIPPAVNAIYGGFSRGAWALALAWMVFACHKGYGGPVNTLLSHPSWQPLSRLTYAMFLTTMPLQLLYRGITYIPLYLNHMNKFTETCGFLFVGGLLAVVLSLIAESPILGMEKLLFNRRGRGSENKPKPAQD